MSNYSDLIRDLPQRCRELYGATELSARSLRREITLLLSVTSLAFVVPFERLSQREQRGRTPRYIQPHNDPEEYADAHRRFQEMLDQPWTETEFVQAHHVRSVQYGTRPFTRDDPRSWPEFYDDSTLLEDMALSARDVLEVIRHALAHGNILTRGAAHIDEVVFIRGGRSIGEKERSENPGLYGKDRHDYVFLRFRPIALQAFFMSWCVFLESLDLPRALPLANEYSEDESRAA
jgi:hypothetical protein